ncbi:MAG: hypothetical protein MP439_10270 [Ferrimicrobium sp.]|nr:hypothetical protein [Ferrimicrobium sp.]
MSDRSCPEWIVGSTIPIAEMGGAMRSHPTLCQMAVINSAAISPAIALESAPAKPASAKVASAKVAVIDPGLRQRSAPPSINATAIVQGPLVSFGVAGTGAC